MATAEDIGRVASAMGIELAPWQLEFMEQLDRGLAKSDFRRVMLARRQARSWLDESNAMLARANEEGLDEATWSRLKLEAEVLRKCAAQILEEVK